MRLCSQDGIKRDARLANTFLGALTPRMSPTSGEGAAAASSAEPFFAPTAAAQHQSPPIAPTPTLRALPSDISMSGQASVALTSKQSNNLKRTRDDEDDGRSDPTKR